MVYSYIPSQTPITQNRHLCFVCPQFDCKFCAELVRCESEGDIGRQGGHCWRKAGVLLGQRGQLFYCFSATALQQPGAFLCQHAGPTRRHRRG